MEDRTREFLVEHNMENGFIGCMITRNNIKQIIHWADKSMIEIIKEFLHETLSGNVTMYDNGIYKDMNKEEYIDILVERMKELYG